MNLGLALTIAVGVILGFALKDIASGFFPRERNGWLEESDGNWTCDPYALEAAKLTRRIGLIGGLIVALAVVAYFAL